MAVEDYIFPAYEKLMRGLEELRGSGSNEKGLCCFPEGRAYYELLARRSVGTGRTVEEMRSLIREQMEDDLSAMEQILGAAAEEAEESARANASILGENAPQLILDRPEGEDPDRISGNAGGGAGSEVCPGRDGRAPESGILYDPGDR